VQRLATENWLRARWSYGQVSVVDSNGRTIWIADAHRDNGKRFIVSADEKLTAFGGENGVKSQGRVAQIGLTGKKKVPKLGEMC
jgi:hypothetical protein